MGPDTAMPSPGIAASTHTDKLVTIQDEGQRDDSPPDCMTCGGEGTTVVAGTEFGCHACFGLGWDQLGKGGAA